MKLPLFNPIKKAIKKIIFNSIEEYNNRSFHQLNNPYKINFYRGSAIINPLRIDGGEFITVGENTYIGRNAWLSAFSNYEKQTYTPQIYIAENVNIGNFSCITAINKILIGSGCLFSEYIYISDHAHGFDPSLNISLAKQSLTTKGEVVIGSNTFLGYRVSILPGVKLGNNCIVGAHSVVTKSFPAYSMIVGSPAELIKKYSFEKKEWEKV